MNMGQLTQAYHHVNHWVLYSNYFQVPRGVNSFDYSKDWNILVSGGVDTTIRLWNPFDYSKPVAVSAGKWNDEIYSGHMMPGDEGP